MVSAGALAGGRAAAHAKLLQPPQILGTRLPAPSVARRTPCIAHSRLAVLASAVLDFNTKVWEKKQTDFAGNTEFIWPGGRDKLEKLPQAFAGIKQIGVIGWGSQAPAQVRFVGLQYSCSRVRPRTLRQTCTLGERTALCVAGFTCYIYKQSSHLFSMAI